MKYVVSIFGKIRYSFFSSAKKNSISAKNWTQNCWIACQTCYQSTKVTAMKKANLEMTTCISNLLPRLQEILNFYVKSMNMQSQWSVKMINFIQILQKGFDLPCLRELTQKIAYLREVGLRMASYHWNFLKLCFHSRYPLGKNLYSWRTGAYYATIWRKIYQTLSFCSSVSDFSWSSRRTCSFLLYRWQSHYHRQRIIFLMVQC